ncbi:MAG: NapH/MauN family ferredoxin-type protein [Gammaproteobacteria bacterium]|nr:NapH/MauN family ferredoxin-type protein [Gammaproteobacteria bacterium]
MKYGRLYKLKVMLGKEPTRPAKDELSIPVTEIYQFKKGNKEFNQKTRDAGKEHKNSNKWLKRRWVTLLFVNLLFVISYFLDIQILEGALSASRFVGFHMADLNSALQVMLASKTLLINLLIGIVTVFIMWVLLGGRTFCSWVCPYHLLSEITERIHLFLVKKKIITDHTFDRRIRLIFYIIFALLAIVTGYTVYEVISPTGILSRALIYGPSIALFWVSFLLLLETFYSRRLWCRYVCPIGLTYGFVGTITPLKVNYNATNCHHEGECKKVCLVPHVLDWVVRNRSPKVNMDLGPDCTRCGLCIDVCPSDSLTYRFEGLSKKLDDDNYPKPD